MHNSSLLWHGMLRRSYLKASKQRGGLGDAQTHAILDNDLRTEVPGVLLKGHHTALWMLRALIYCGLDGCCVVGLAISHSTMVLQVLDMSCAAKCRSLGRRPPCEKHNLNIIVEMARMYLGGAEDLDRGCWRLRSSSFKCGKLLLLTQAWCQGAQEDQHGHQYTSHSLLRLLEFLQGYLRALMSVDLASV